jgi:predicted nucleotidyltransferase
VITPESYPIQQLELELGASWENLNKARQLALSTKEILLSRLEKHTSDDANIVVFGSLARNEYTDGSDIDWTLLLDGKAKSNYLSIKNQINKIIKAIENKPPGQEGTFGNISISHDIIYKIGGGDDTNKNTTQRILLLLESTSIGNGNARTRTINEVLNRYIGDDWAIRNKIDTMPRFLLNDIVRFWRTLCVDFAYKRKERDGKGWAIRTIKLRLSRKLIYVSGLIACYSCMTNDELIERISAVNQRSDRKQMIIDYITSQIKMTPLDIFSSAVLNNKVLYESAKKVIDSYDEFIGLLSDKDKREELENISPETTGKNELYEHARRLGHTFQSGLNQIYLHKNDSRFYELTKTYGVF